MRVTSLSLRNFRVFPELDLEMPPGVVGIYGQNGAGKSTLVESILWALFGVARTAKESLRRDGATGETEATVEFEHDGHLYEVTRSLAGAANGVKAEAACDGQRVAAGAVAVRQYVHHVLGMSAEAFRSSVFCEQKQLDAFSGRRPEERRKLVLDLLGITPIDRARDSARAQARSAVEQIEAARLVLGDVEALAAEATDLEARLVAATAVRLAAEAAQATAAGAEAAATAAEARLEAALSDARAADGLDPEAPCPLCGQELGSSFDEVQRHREAARQEAAAVAEAIAGELSVARAERAAADRAAGVAGAELRRARRHHERCAALVAEVHAARTALDEAETVVAATVSVPDAEHLRGKAIEAEAARDAALRLEERLSARPALGAAVAAEEAVVADAGEEVARLLADGKALCFDAGAHAAAGAARAAAAQAVEQSRAALTDARLDERGLSERLAERRSRLDAEIARRAELAGREGEARHLGRLAELLGEFRNSLVAQVGPALSSQTSALFRELTDGRFDGLEVDGDTFELRVGSAGHPLDRHSGSETDLANLSLRVAIGEQVNLLSGGAVGLLVLDEVLGALDGEHRDRLLAALTRLGARFRQVLVVTHATDVKEQLPHAIAVEPQGGGRSDAACATAGIRLAEVN